MSRSTAVISVCLATYNGASYLECQIASILGQIQEGDELVIVDDASTDSTISIINSFVDPRIHLYQNEKNIGHVRTFEYALSKAKGDFIFLSDQDDVWLPGRLVQMIELMNDAPVLLLTTRYGLIDKHGRHLDNPKLFLHNRLSRRYIANIVGIFMGRRTYYGCTMALSSKFLDLALPIPGFVESHDLWLAILANCCKANRHGEILTVNRRIHGQNLTKRSLERGAEKVLKSRLLMFLSVVVAFYRTIIKFDSSCLR